MTHTIGINVPRQVRYIRHGCRKALMLIRMGKNNPGPRRNNAGHLTQRRDEGPEVAAMITVTNQPAGTRA